MKEENSAHSYTEGSEETHQEMEDKFAKASASLFDQSPFKKFSLVPESPPTIAGTGTEEPNWILCTVRGGACYNPTCGLKGKCVDHITIHEYYRQYWTPKAEPPKQESPELCPTCSRPKESTPTTMCSNSFHLPEQESLKHDPNLKHSQKLEMYRKYSKDALIDMIIDANMVVPEQESYKSYVCPKCGEPQSSHKRCGHPFHTPDILKGEQESQEEIMNELFSEYMTMIHKGESTYAAVDELSKKFKIERK